MLWWTLHTVGRESQETATCQIPGTVPNCSGKGTTSFCILHSHCRRLVSVDDCPQSVAKIRLTYSQATLCVTWVCDRSHSTCFFQPSDRGFWGMNLYTFPRDVVFLLRCCFCREGKFPEAFTQSFLPYWPPVCEEERLCGDSGTMLVSHLLPLSSKFTLQYLLQGKGLDHSAFLRAQNVMLSFASRVRRRPLNQEGAALPGSKSC